MFGPEARAPGEAPAPEGGDPIRWYRTRTRFPEGGEPLHRLVAARAGEAPGALAVTWGDPEGLRGGTLTYGELHRRSRSLAAELVRRGVGKDEVVCVSAERSPELVIALLAVLEAGGAYLPLEPSDPPQRIRMLLSDVRPRVVLAPAAVGDRLPPVHAQLVDPGEIFPGDDERENGPERTGARRPSSGRDLAYVLHTSGSTGRPKGVLVEHRSIVNRLLWARDVFSVGPDDVILHKTPLAFDVAVTEIFWPLVSGARLVLAGPGEHRDPRQIARLVEREGVTILHFVPSMLPSFLDLPGLEESCRSVRHVLAGGETLTAQLARRFYERTPEGVELHNLYGPTEATVAATHWPVPRESADDVVPIGRPVANTRVYVLDGNGSPVPVGREGELHVAGVQVARGYLERPELTRDRFVPDPFAEDPDERMYRTGDRARWRPDGTLEFLGRQDRQIKVRGARIEPGEVEAALLRQDGVRDAVVALRSDEASGEARLVAYLTAGAGGAPGPSELHRALSQELPEVMVPSAFVELPELPRGPTEKVDVSRLPAPERGRPDLAEAYAAPGDELERFLAKLWADVLGLERVGVRDRFFELGGTSLQAARIVNRVAEELDETVYVVTLFDAPTVRSYGQLLRRDYAPAVQRVFGGDATHRPPSHRPSRMLDQEAEQRFRAAVPHFPMTSTAVGRDERNPPALFILAPPRSGTTLLRVMLAGHPEIFAAPELQLLSFETLPQRREQLSGKHSLWLEGTVRSVMELAGIGPDEAWDVVAEHEGEGLGTLEFFRLLQGWASPRLVADKSPSYALDPDALRRAEAGFRDPFYIHLVRHPWATVRSFRKQRLEQVLFLREHPFTADEVAELVWRVSHRNVVEFLDRVPGRRWIRLTFEELVNQPEATMREICRRLGLRYEPEMADPYRSLDGKMVDGLHPESTPMGDRSFTRARKIDPSVARRHLEELEADALSPLTWELARALGYDVPVADGPGPDREEGPRSGAGDRGRLRRERLSALAGHRRGRSRGHAGADERDAGDEE